MSNPPEVDLFRVIVRSRHIQHIEQALEDAGALSVYLASSDEMPLADPRQSDFRLGDQIEALFDYPPDRAPWQALDPQADIHIERVEKIDWVSQSQQNLPRINAPPYCVFGAHARPAHHSYRTAIEALVDRDVAAMEAISRPTAPLIRNPSLAPALLQAPKLP